MIRLAVDGTALFRSQPTGVDRYARELITAIAEVRADWDIVIARWKSRTVAGLPLVDSGRASIHEAVLPREAYRIAELAHVPVPIDTMMRTRADVWLFPNFVSLPLLRRAPSITVVHDLSFRIPERFSHRMHRSFLERQVRRATRTSHLATVSAFVKDQLCDAYALPADDVAVVHPGVDLVQFHPASQRECTAIRKSLGLDRPYLLTIGALHARKNLVRLIEAFSELGELAQGLDLVLVGGVDAHSAPVLEAISSYQGAGRVRHLGYVADSDLPGLYSAALLTVIPSVYEGFGLPVLEAMACGSPVVAARGGALQEAAGNAAVLVDSRSPTSIRDAIAAVISDDAMTKELRSRGQQRADTFSWRASGEAMASLLEAELS